METKRTLNLLKLLDKRSYFLFGPRGTGKSYLIRQTLTGQADYFNLLRSETYLRLKTHPSDLESMITQNWVVIDEIQRIPELLNEVHHLIAEKNIHFLLTGSSARKLKREHANMLAGRAFQAEFFPLTWYELTPKNQFVLDSYLTFGGLPEAVLGEHQQDYLYSYVDTYLKEEIHAEALVRNLANFSRFLQTAALSNGEIINYTKIANDAQLSPNTVRDYYQILIDTLVGFYLPTWKSSKRKAIQSPKFYFFDIGVANTLCHRHQMSPHSSELGKAFEHFIIQEIRAYLSYNKVKKELCYWHSRTHQEVDIIIGNEVVIEVKLSRTINERHHKNLKLLLQENKWKKVLIVSQDKQEMKFKNGIQHLHWKHFLEQLWQHKII